MSKYFSIFVVIVLCLGIQAHAKSQIVGDSEGWTFGVAGWENGKTFEAGETLVFNYAPNKHNVVRVDKESYETCTVSKNDKMYNSGNDQITVDCGSNYYICGFPGHCQKGMKIAVIGLLC